MIKTIVYIALILFMSSNINIGEAALVDRGNGLIYDDYLNITWLQNANYAGQTMTWQEANDWAANLIFQGYEDWRLPEFDCTGTTCSSGEMGHLYDSYGISSETPGSYIDIRPSMYWSGTEDSSNPVQAYRFNFKYGSDGISDKSLKRYAWAVREGDVSPPVAPEPISSILFLTGGATLGVRKYFNKNRNTH